MKSEDGRLTGLQKILLLLLAGMLVCFGALMAVLRAHPGVRFEGALLRAAEEEGRIVYSGKAHGDPVTVSVSFPTNFRTVVELAVGDRLRDVCEVEYPLAPVQTAWGTVNGIRVTKNGTLLFTGAYDPEEDEWYDGEGAWTPQVDSRAYGSADPWQGFRVTPSLAVRFAFGPEPAARGDPGLFALAVFLTALTALEIAFHKSLFYLRHWAARDPEPSEEYLALERVGWVVLVCVTAGVYIAAMAAIP